MSVDRVQCRNCGKMTVRKKRCMYCFATLPVEDQLALGGTEMPYWHRDDEG